LHQASSGRRPVKRGLRSGRQLLQFGPGRPCLRRPSRRRWPFELAGGRNKKTMKAMQVSRTHKLEGGRSHHSIGPHQGVLRLARRRRPCRRGRSPGGRPGAGPTKRKNMTPTRLSALISRSTASIAATSAAPRCSALPPPALRSNLTKRPDRRRGFALVTACHNRPRPGCPAACGGGTTNFAAAPVPPKPCKQIRPCTGNRLYVAFMRSVALRHRPFMAFRNNVDGAAIQVVRIWRKVMRSALLAEPPRRNGSLRADSAHRSTHDLRCSAGLCGHILIA